MKTTYELIKNPGDKEVILCMSTDRLYLNLLKKEHIKKDKGRNEYQVRPQIIRVEQSK